MASKSYPRGGYNAGTITEAEHERLVHTWAPDGMIGLPADLPLVYADNTGLREVKLRASKRAVVRGSQWDSGGEDISMPALPANVSGVQRVDLIVLRLYRSDYQVIEHAITGTPGQGAPAPVTDALYHDLPVATIKVDPGVNSIAANRVTPVAWYIGDDGQILCTATTRPPHYPGRRIYETDTGRELRSTGLAWLVVSEDSGDVNLTAAVNWYSAMGKIRRINGVGHLNMLFGRTGQGLGLGIAQTMCTLPAGFRPSTDWVAAGRMVSANNGSVGIVTIATSGLVTLVSHGGLGNTSQVWISDSFPVAV